MSPLKQQLEYLVADIASHLLNRYFITSSKPVPELIEDLSESLAMTSQMEGYDERQIRRLLRWESLELLDKPGTRMATFELPNIICYYIWTAEAWLLNELANRLYDKHHIVSVKEFKRLFQVNSTKAPHTGDLTVRLYRKSLPLLVVLFSILKEKSLIRIKGTHGHFKPLQLYGVDEENRILFEKTPRQVHYTIKKNGALFDQYKNKIYKWLEI